ncbi:insulin-like growth factor-binding protein 3 isoform X2 [Kryptolebias marmoratus]|uniref:Insulin-like growth factor-binding protein 3 n=1 Tax=Kryptolebias marmoratus TaxID=37003 RepID=A0A3Q3B2V3_KRYMA|nr:insulin-like growth factor-binding protein 3 isoform X2 [Kryptolebias marmoratus]
MPALCALCLAVALAAVARLAGSVGPVVRCEPCDAGALLQCKPLPKDCAEMVREPGCGCCMTCALGEGQACGVYTARCGSNLTCRHQPGESRPLQALLEGRGVCTSAASKKLHSILIPAQKPESAGNQVEDCANVTQTTTVVPPVVTMKNGHSQGSTNTRPPMNNKLLQKAQNKKTQSYKVEPVSRGANVDMHNFSLENKRETEYGPCRREIDSILNSLKINNVLNPRGFRIPNCDRKGFYKKKQCRPSKGRRRGFCWCVDKYGHPLPGYNDREHSEKKCYNLEGK